MDNGYSLYSNIQIRKKREGHETKYFTVDYERLKEEMSELYGKDALKIHCQETRTELAFTEWRDKHRPVTWPAMPLNMSLIN